MVDSAVISRAKVKKAYNILSVSERGERSILNRRGRRRKEENREKRCTDITTHTNSNWMKEEVGDRVFFTVYRFFPHSYI